MRLCASRTERCCSSRQRHAVRSTGRGSVGEGPPPSATFADGGGLMADSWPLAGLDAASRKWESGWYSCRATSFDTYIILQSSSERVYGASRSGCGTARARGAQLPSPDQMAISVTAAQPFGVRNLRGGDAQPPRQSRACRGRHTHAHVRAGLRMLHCWRVYRMYRLTDAQRMCCGAAWPPVPTTTRVVTAWLCAASAPVRIFSAGLLPDIQEHDDDLCGQSSWRRRVSAGRQPSQAEARAGSGSGDAPLL